jgi:hypothetical protein
MSDILQKKYALAMQQIGVMSDAYFTKAAELDAAMILIAELRKEKDNGKYPGTESGTTERVDGDNESHGDGKNKNA